MTVFALSCHPDDIEFMMAGTLLLLRDAQCSIHYMNLADGSCGSTIQDAAETARIRRGEAMESARLLGATFHDSLAHDIEVFYGDELIRRTTAVIREAAPDILLLPSPEDYMEDHMITARIGVTAAFCRGMPNYRSVPPRAPVLKDVVLYHAMPAGLIDGLRRPVHPDFYVDIQSVIDRKEKMLACHASQKRWLDESQGFDSYLAQMRDLSARVGQMSGRCRYAEAWRRHLHLGFSAREEDPLSKLLSGFVAASGS